MKSIIDVIKDTKKVWDEDPEGWNVISYRNSNNYPTQIISHRNEDRWAVKSIPLSPFESVGVGSRVEKVDEKLVRKVRAKGELFPFLLADRNDSSIAAVGTKIHYVERNPQLNAIIPKRIDSEMTEDLEKLIRKERPAYFDMYI